MQPLNKICHGAFYFLLNQVMFSETYNLGEFQNINTIGNSEIRFGYYYYLLCH